MRELSLFSGIGGGIYGSLILGWETAAYVEKDEYCQAVIRRRIADGWFHQGNIYGDITEFNRHHAAEYAGTIDVLTGGFPCQPFSLAGKRKGTDDERYLFAEIVKTIEVVQPRICFLKTSPASSPARPLSKFTARSTGSVTDPNPHWCLEVLTAETSTNGNACGFTPPVRIPTVGANEYKGSGRARYRGSPEYRGAKASEGLRTSSADPIYLTPSFAEWMMNFPIGSSGLKPLATDKTQS